MTSRDLDVHALETEAIKQAYAVTVEPERLADFEAIWEEVIDATTSDKGAAGDDATHESITAHVARALEIIERLRVQPWQMNDAQTIVDSAHGFAMIVDLNGRIVVKNRLAREQLSEQRVLSETGWDRPSLKRIEDWLSRLERSNDPSGQFVHVWLGSAQKKTCLFMSPIDLSGKFGSQPHEHVLLASTEIEITADTIAAIRTTFDLTLAEGSVAAELANGMSPSEISDLRGASLNTVRTQIKQILAKTDSNGVADLVRRICGMSSRFAAITAQAGLQSERFRSAAEFRIGSMTLADGRYLEYTEMGHPRGKPVIFSHHIMEGPRWTVSGAREAGAMGIRIIAPTMPGYGNSEIKLCRNYDEVLNSWINDLKQLQDHLGIERAVVVGKGAQAFAVNHADRVKGIAFINTLPTWNMSRLDHLGPRQRRAIKTSLYAPKLLSYPPRVAKILIDSGRERIFIDGLNHGNPVDQQAMEDPEVYEAYADAARSVIKQGVRAFVQNMPGGHTDFSEQAKLLTSPVTVILGSANGYHPVDSAFEYQQLVPHAKIRIVEGAGTYLVLSHYKAVLTELEELST